MAARELIRSRKQAPAREEIEQALDELPELEPIPDNSRTHAARHDL